MIVAGEKAARKVIEWFASTVWRMVDLWAELKAVQMAVKSVKLSVASKDGYAVVNLAVSKAECWADLMVARSVLE